MPDKPKEAEGLPPFGINRRLHRHLISHDSQPALRKPEFGTWVQLSSKRTGVVTLAGYATSNHFPTSSLFKASPENGSPDDGLDSVAVTTDVAAFKEATSHWPVLSPPWRLAMFVFPSSTASNQESIRRRLRSITVWDRRTENRGAWTKESRVFLSAC